MISVAEENGVKRYDAKLCIAKKYCELCDRPLDGSDGEVRYEIFKRTIGDASINIRKMVICERCMKEIIEEIEE